MFGSYVCKASTTPCLLKLLKDGCMLFFFAVDSTASTTWMNILSHSNILFLEAIKSQDLCFSATFADKSWRIFPCQLEPCNLHFCSGFHCINDMDEHTLTFYHALPWSWQKVRIYAFLLHLLTKAGGFSPASLSHVIYISSHPSKNRCFLHSQKDLWSSGKYFLTKGFCSIFMSFINIEFPGLNSRKAINGLRI